MISVLDLGLCDYGTALRLQERLVELRKTNRIGDVLLLLEHTPVITLGRNARQSNIVAPQQVLAERGVETFEINRGGDVTFHGPGQLVAYPIFNLLQFTPKVGVVEYVRKLEEVLIHVCGQYRLETQRIKGLTGVWTFATPPPRLEQRAMGRDYVPEITESESPTLTAEMAPQIWATERKIAAIGVHISRGVTSHGFALNVTTDLEYFKLIVPCGLTKPVTSIEFESGECPAMDEVKHIAVRAFSQVFREQVLWLQSMEDLLATAEGSAPHISAEERGAHVGHQPAPEPQDTPVSVPENLRRLRGEDTHLA
ncbi:MAG TPA: lipoyl(octanoyl) transferase [Candidatus Acidoferrales bacterium]|nr:lipoyl(octanoyl) transferase [Candidatus Acidoferrales bacterium]